VSKVVVADDEASICRAFSQFLELEGHTPLIASNGREALELVEREGADAVFLDVRMPGMDGLEVLSRLRSMQPDLPVIVMTAYGTMETAMDAMGQGAFDYLGKPVDLARLRALLRRALYRSSAAGAPSPAPPASASKARSLIGQSASMQEIYKLMGLLTQNDLTVLVTGESGVGKELVARGIHDYAPRRTAPFVAINCAAIADNLLESELFGHEKGAFTGADQRRIGRCEAAGEGTLFLDEIGEMPLPLQGKLLRVLQERSFERVGSTTPIALRARIIAASNRNLEGEVARGRFREDLYHRLRLVTLLIPPLRKRKDDIGILAEHFLHQANTELGRQLGGMEPSVLDALESHDWPGNVRELEHTIKRAVLLARGPLLTVDDLALPVVRNPAGQVSAGGAPQSLQDAVRHSLEEMLEQGSMVEGGIYHAIIDAVGRELISEALRRTDGNQVAASRLLGLHRTTMRKRMPGEQP
jgi:nitrogen regulation protein NR(I)